MRIGTRLMIGFSILCLLMTVITGFTAFEAARVSHSVTQMIETEMPIAQNTLSLSKQIASGLAALRGYLLTGKEVFKQERREAWQEIDALGKKLDAASLSFANDEGRRVWRDTKQTLTELKAAQDKAENIGPGENAVKTLAEEAVPRAQKIVAALDGVLGGDGKRMGGLLVTQQAALAQSAADPR